MPHQPARYVFLPSPYLNPSLNLKNIQGDIPSGLVKKAQNFYFLEVTDVGKFKTRFPRFAELVTNALDANQDRRDVFQHRDAGKKTLLNKVGVNIAFSYKGLKKLIKSDDLPNESHFVNGQISDAKNLGDDLKHWLPVFKQDDHDIDAVILITAETPDSVTAMFTKIEAIFNEKETSSMKVIDTIKGTTRPDDHHADEHFGFRDGISNPRIKKYNGNQGGPNDPPPIDAGHLITGYEKDPVPNRPEWQKDGSFLAFRYLTQKVPEFNLFLRDHAIKFPGADPDIPRGSALLGARFVGRWKSGAPIDLAPFRDNPDVATDVNRVNGFKFAAQKTFQRNCPFSAHARKMNPRADRELGTFDQNMILRRGIPFGDEVTLDEESSNTTQLDRGLLFTCYQSSIENGFFFLQKSWANNENFPEMGSGLDPIIGQGTRSMIGTDPDHPDKSLNLGEFVISKGGEYFFSPSLKCLKEVIPKQ